MKSQTPGTGKMRLLDDTAATRYRYEAILAAARTASVYQTIEWLDVFRSLSANLAFVEVDGDTLVPFVCKGRGALRRAFSLPYDTYGGPITTASNGPVVFEHLADRLDTASVRMVDFCSQVVPVNGDDVARTASTHVIDLSGGYEKVRGRYADSNRRLIRQSTERGIRIDTMKDISQIPVFHRLLTRTVRKYGAAPLPMSFFELLYRNMVPIGMARFYLAWLDDRVVAGNLVLSFREASYDWMWVYDERYLGLRSTNALIDRAIRDEITRGARVLNLGASPDERLGSVRFKRSFGARPRDYHIYTRVGRYYSAARVLTDSARRIRVSLRG